MSWGMMGGGHMGGWGVMELEGWRKGPWTAEEDRLLMDYVRLHGEGRWNSVARLAGLKRNGKSCRLRWVNYLRPDLKRGQITPHEESIILDLHARWGNRWSTIARSLPGRTDNEIKNYWRTHFKKKTKASPDKAKSRLLRRQQFHQQMQQSDHQAFVSLMEESDTSNHYKTCSTMMPPPQVSPLDQHTTMTSAHGEQQTYWNNNVVEALNEDAIIWDHGWWNLEESLGAKAASMHNFVPPLC